MAATQTLYQATLGTPSALKNALIIVGGSLLVALGAQVSVPMLPVPMTLQTLAILTIAFSVGSRLGAGVVLAYLAQGAMGLPVFSNGAAGFAWLMGPTAGFLWGFVPMAWLAGKAVELGLARGVFGTAFAGIVATALLYVPGVLWLSAATTLDLQGAINAGMMPFLLGDAVKAVIAALVVTGAWAAMGKRAR